MKILYVLIFFATSVHAHTLYEYAQSYAQHPFRHELLYNAGVEAARMRDYKQAYDYFTAFTNHINEHEYSLQHKEQAWYNRGNAAFQIKEYHEALTSFEQVVACNQNNELARKKIAYIKQLLEQQQKQQDENSEHKEQDQDKKEQKQEKTKTEDNKKQKKENEKKGNDFPDENEKDKNDSCDGEEKDEDIKKQDEKQNGKQDDDPESSKEDQKNEQQEKQKQQEPGAAGDKRKQESQPGAPQEEIPLTEQEQHILAAMEDLDKKMNEAMELQKLKKVQGSPYARNNW